MRSTLSALLMAAGLIAGCATHENTDRHMAGDRARAAVSRTSAWDTAFRVVPAAALVISEIPRTRKPACLAASASGTVDIPTASAPSVRSIAVSAGVS